MPFINLTRATGRTGAPLLVNADLIQRIEDVRISESVQCPGQNTRLVIAGYVVYVKESPAKILSLISEAESLTICDPECRIGIADHSPLADDGAAECINRALRIEALEEQLAEAQADAKTADERAEWYKQKLAEEKELHEKTRLLAKDRISDLESELKKWQRGDIRYSSLYGFGITHSSYLK